MLSNINTTPGSAQIKALESPLARRLLQNMNELPSHLTTTVLAASLIILAGATAAVVQLWVSKRFKARKEKELDLEAQDLKIATLLGIPVADLLSAKGGFNSRTPLLSNNMRRGGIVPPQVLFARILSPKTRRKRSMPFTTRPSPLRQVVYLATSDLGSSNDYSKLATPCPPASLSPKLTSWTPSTAAIRLQIENDRTAAHDAYAYAKRAMKSLSPRKKHARKSKLRPLSLAEANTLVEPVSCVKGSVEITKDYLPPYDGCYRWGTVTYRVDLHEQRRKSMQGKENQN